MGVGLGGCVRGEGGGVRGFIFPIEDGVDGDGDGGNLVRK